MAVAVGVGDKWHWVGQLTHTETGGAHIGALTVDFGSHANRTLAAYCR